MCYKSVIFFSGIYQSWLLCAWNRQDWELFLDQEWEQYGLAGHSLDNSVILSLFFWPLETTCMVAGGTYHKLIGLFFGKTRLGSG